MQRWEVFTWGYDGWGSTVKNFLRSVDALEKSRGYEPPMFIDLRMQRSVRARDFRGAALQEIVSPSRYRWMSGLGNLGIIKESTKRIEIKKPRDAIELLHRIQGIRKEKRRAILFCHCPHPLSETGRSICCHRAEVARLLSAAARLRREEIKISEWPGSSPQTATVEQLTAAQEHALAHDLRYVPIGEAKQEQLPPLHSLAWGSQVVFKDVDEDRIWTILTGPARVVRGTWVLDAPYRWSGNVGQNDLRASRKKIVARYDVSRFNSMPIRTSDAKILG